MEKPVEPGPTASPAEWQKFAQDATAYAEWLKENPPQPGPGPAPEPPQE